jgi:hypothetical protein
MDKQCSVDSDQRVVLRDPGAEVSLRVPDQAVFYIAERHALIPILAKLPVGLELGIGCPS